VNCPILAEVASCVKVVCKMEEGTAVPSAMEADAQVKVHLIERWEAAEMEKGMAP
jgi:hypothetical protein